jgi:phage gp46-like protein
MTEFEYKDIKLHLDVALYGEFFDIVPGDNDFVIENSFDTVELISQLSDRRVPKEEAQDGYRGGFWGCEIMGIDPAKWGSKQWTLFRKKLTKTTIRLWEKYTEDAYQWMIDAGILKSVKCTAYTKGNKLFYEVEKTLPSDEKKINKYSKLWSSYRGI